ncbi:hypothetical protein [Motiliproteus sediminis]|uniref:hypothetical protein n=1 Tax=Motiliproteus sediminis TaxID=1468178 RepID=UPI001AEF8190|nr:hypothetical protein [Motiliproteus sediminis]
MSIEQLKLTEAGTIDLAFYQRQGELARAEAMRELVAQLGRATKRLFKLRIIRFDHSDLFRHAH